MGDPKLAIKELSVHRGGRLILSVPYFDVRAGEVLAVLGPNGAGKSTLLQVMALLERPASGAVFFDGQRVEGNPLPYRRRLALVFQEPLLLDTSVEKNVRTGLALRGLSRREQSARAGYWLERLGIAHLARRSARTLSGGEAQRASLARALALEPELLLLDEPFAALDPPMRDSFLNDLEAILRDRRLTTVFVTHDRSEALRLGDRVAVMMDGAIRQVGTVAEVFAAPVDEEVAAFVGVETIVPGRVQSLADGLAQIDLGPDQVRVEAAAPHLGRQAEVLVCLRPEDIVLEPARPDSHPTSARNHLRGTVRRITAAGGQVRVVLDCGFTLVALITKQSLEEMGLGVGVEALASFK
ncbi:MAG: ATP-binding cassette domain-containing protein, partial [Chloroflexota bacterium]|nr:ATP-binding cassette domain-containing protein [Chloroflexota bacterium]